MFCKYLDNLKLRYLEPSRYGKLVDVEASSSVVQPGKGNVGLNRVERGMLVEGNMAGKRMWVSLRCPLCISIF